MRGRHALTCSKRSPTLARPTEPRQRLTERRRDAQTSLAGTGLAEPKLTAWRASYALQSGRLLPGWTMRQAINVLIQKVRNLYRRQSRCPTKPSPSLTITLALNGLKPTSSISESYGYASLNPTVARSHMAYTSSLSGQVSSSDPKQYELDLGKIR